MPWHRPMRQNLIMLALFCFSAGLPMAASAQGAKKAADCPFPFVMRRVTSISIQDYSSLTKPVWRWNKQAVISFNQFDDEDYPVWKNMRGVALIEARVMGMRTPALGFILYSKYTLNRSSTISQINDDDDNTTPAEAIIDIEADDEDGDCHVNSTISLNEKGEIRLGSTKIGQLSFSIVF